MNLELDIEFPNSLNELKPKELKRVSKGYLRNKNAFELSLEFIKNRLSRKEWRLFKRVRALEVSEQLRDVSLEVFSKPKLDFLPYKKLGREKNFLDVNVGEYEAIIDFLQKKKSYTEVCAIVYPGIKLKDWEEVLVMIWISSSLEKIDTVFAELKTGGGEGVGDLGFTDLIHAGAGERNGTRKEIRETKVWEFLYDMLLQKRIADKVGKGG